jgi:hypothetical protein
MAPSEERAALLSVSTLPVALVVALLSAPAQADGLAFFNARGIDPTRGSVSELPFEHIDPLTGNLVLNFTDLTLPGDGGFDLRIQRTYSSKIYRDLGQGIKGEESWAGFGWILHMGRVFDPLGTSPVVEMPDGTQQMRREPRIPTASSATGRRPGNPVPVSPT